MTQTTTYEQQAYERGCEAARAAANWVADGNTSSEYIRWLLKMIEDGDPLMDQYLPSRPDLSAEWGGDETEASLVESIVPIEVAATIPYDSITEAWERGVDETFLSACETELRKWL